MRVTLSAELYRQIEGWVAGIVAGPIRWAAGQR
jgi:hypothetical protein